ncbi:hypothetical protein ACIQ9P_38320 [Kitasatospora sp. NPDC094019]|uniref:hypothetical protein n=1 Tax=Kitasatospora sp. NPDC094019 TaxID=3364091 RepID=UPI00380D3A46
MTQWIRAHSAEDGIWSYFELDDEGWALRQVDLKGAARLWVTAAALTEVLELRDSAGPSAMSDYERKYGVLAEGPLAGWEELAGAIEVTEDTFEGLWVLARQHLGSADSSVEQEESP